MPKKPSKRTLKWIVRGGRWSRSALFIGFRYWKAKQRPRCPRASCRATAGSRRKLVDVAAKEPLRVKEILVDEGALVKPGQVLVQLDTVTLDAELAEANAQRRGRPGAAGRRQGLHRQAEERDRARRHRGRALRRTWSRTAPARSGSWTSARPSCDDHQGHPRRSGGDAADRQAGGRGRPGQRGDDPDAHRRRDAQVARHRTGALSPGRARRGARARRQGADAGEPGGRLHGDLPPVGGGRRA